MKKILFDKENESRPYVAVCAVIYRMIDGKKHILLGKRINVAGAGYYYLPGGHIHEGEKIADAIKREVKEECGLDVEPIQIVWYEENFEHLHHINMYYEVRELNAQKEPENLEPHKCTGWRWYPVNDPPHPLWVSLGEFLKKSS